MLASGFTNTLREIGLLDVYPLLSWTNFHRNATEAWVISGIIAVLTVIAIVVVCRNRNNIKVAGDKPLQIAFSLCAMGASGLLVSAFNSYLLTARSTGSLLQSVLGKNDALWGTIFFSHVVLYGLLALFLPGKIAKTIALIALVLTTLMGLLFLLDYKNSHF